MKPTRDAFKMRLARRIEDAARLQTNQAWEAVMALYDALLPRIEALETYERARGIAEIRESEEDSDKCPYCGGRGNVGIHDPHGPMIYGPGQSCFWCNGTGEIKSPQVTPSPTSPSPSVEELEIHHEENMSVVRQHPSFWSHQAALQSSSALIDAQTKRAEAAEAKLATATDTFTMIALGGREAKMLQKWASEALARIKSKAEEVSSGPVAAKGDADGQAAESSPMKSSSAPSLPEAVAKARERTTKAMTCLPFADHKEAWDDVRDRLAEKVKESTKIRDDYFEVTKGLCEKLKRREEEIEMLRNECADNDVRAEAAEGKLKIATEALLGIDWVLGSTPPHGRDAAIQRAKEALSKLKAGEVVRGARASDQGSEAPRMANSPALPDAILKARKEMDFTLRHANIMYRIDALDIEREITDAELRRMAEEIAVMREKLMGGD